MQRFHRSYKYTNLSKFSSKFPIFKNYHDPLFYFHVKIFRPNFTPFNQNFRNLPRFKKKKKKKSHVPCCLIFFFYAKIHPLPNQFSVINLVRVDLQTHIPTTVNTSVELCRLVLTRASLRFQFSGDIKRRGPRKRRPQFSSFPPPSPSSPSIEPFQRSR